QRFRDDYTQLGEERNRINAELDSGSLTGSARKQLSRQREAVENRRQRMREGSDDYYPYTYLAQEGFLPNYAFPRRAAFAIVDVDGRQERIGRGRSVALREFAPQNTLYLKGQSF